MLTFGALHPAGRCCGPAQVAGDVSRGWHLAWRPGLENCHQMPGIAVENLGTFAAVESLTEGSQAVGPVGKASVGMDF